MEYLKELLSSCTRSGRRGYWTVRLSVDLEHLGRKEESLQVAEMGVNDPSIRGGDLVALQRRVVRLSKPPRRWKKPPYADALELKVEEVIIVWPCLASYLIIKHKGTYILLSRVAAFLRCIYFEHFHIL